MLQTPAVRDEFTRQIVQQLGMARWVATDAKVTWSIHQTLAEMMMPEAIHNDAGGEWVFGMGDPVRQSEATLRFGGILIAEGGGGVFGP